MPQSLYNNALDYVSLAHKRVKGSARTIDVTELPNLEIYQKYFPETFYYVTDVIKERFVHLSPSVKSIFGIDHKLGQEMHAAEFMNRIVHPDDLMSVLKIYDDFNDLLKRSTVEEIKNLRLVRDFRLKNRAGEYKKIVDQCSVLKCTDCNEILNLFGAISLSPSVGEFDKPSAVVVDTRTGQLVESFNANSKQPEQILTKREIQILRLLAIGNKNQQVADKLSISVHTVETHRKHIMRKLSISNPVDLVWKALELHLVT